MFDPAFSSPAFSFPASISPPHIQALHHHRHSPILCHHLRCSHLYCHRCILRHLLWCSHLHRHRCILRHLPLCSRLHCQRSRRLLVTYITGPLGELYPVDNDFSVAEQDCGLSPALAVCGLLCFFIRLLYWKTGEYMSKRIKDILKDKEFF